MKSKKSALLLSVTSLLICFAMLVGSTFAWFTDTATTGVNKIVAGNLDITVEYAKEKMNDDGTLAGELTDWTPIDNATNVFDPNALWEPGRTEYVVFKITNNGNLALKYKLSLETLAQKPGTNKANEQFYLADYLCASAKVNPNVIGSGMSSIGAFMTKLNDLGEAGVQNVLDPEYHPLTDATVNGTLLPGKTNCVPMAIWMPTSVGNEANAISPDKAATIDFGITVVATQDTVENDSFNNTYDAGAEEDEFRQGVTISGIAGVADSYSTIQDAYEAVKAMLVANSGLAEEALSEEAFNAFFTDDGKITWTIYGNQKVTDNRMFSFGRAANRFGDGLQITEINIVGGNSSASLDLSAVNGTFALPYNWWNVAGSANTTLKCKNITFNGIKYMPSATYQCTLYPTTYEFDGCMFNGNLYSYQNFDVNMTIKNCTFNAPANTQYAFMSQGKGGTITLDNNIFNNYTRGINLERATADFVITNNTIRSTVSELDRGAIQLTDGKSFVVTGNKVDVNAGNAFWFHNAATNADVTYTISNNDIKAPYIGYYGTSFDVNDKITSSGNKFNSTDTTKCMKKGATVAEATNLTAIH